MVHIKSQNTRSVNTCRSFLLASVMQFQCSPLLSEKNKNLATSSCTSCIGVRAPPDLGGVGGGGGGGEKNYTVPESASVVQFKRTQIALKTKTFTVLTSNETVIIPKIVVLK